MSESVLIIGGGVGGLTAAHELAERGFKVTVLERWTVPGGKARSIQAKGTGRDGRPDLPAEHGFRFFPGFYKHVPDTMRRIPFGTNADGVFGNLTSSPDAEVARVGVSERPMILPCHRPDSVQDFVDLFNDVFRSHLGIPEADMAHFVHLVLSFLSMCDERRYDELETKSWWEHSDAANRSPQFRAYLAAGLTRTLVAARAEEISARTALTILVQLLIDMSEHGQSADRVLRGPTNEVWIEPWLDHLRSNLGVDYVMGATVVAIKADGPRITGVDVKIDASTKHLTADWYVAAVPVEALAPLVSESMKVADPILGSLGQMRTRWMNGVMFYLREAVPVVKGHVLYLDSQWALTSISQGQFWPDVNLGERGNGDAHDIISVDVSDWESLSPCRNAAGQSVDDAHRNDPGVRPGKRAMDCSAEELVEEVWLQMQDHLNHHTVLLHDEDRVGSFVDPDIRIEGGNPDVNAEPLLINTAGSWPLRPSAGTAIQNLVLASDYVRTYTDLATMEGANEAARRAVNAILDRTTSSASQTERCGIWPLVEPAIFKHVKDVDRFVFRHLSRQYDGHSVGPGPGR